jgi:sugar-specific transcriptional regulator TrmB
VSLGLSFLQAKVYLALTVSGISTGREVAKKAKIAPQDVYRILAELQEKSLVEKIIDRPNKYRPIPLKNGLLMLLQQRNSETTELQQAVFEMVKWFENPKSCSDKKHIGDFALVPAKESIENRIIKFFETAQTALDLMNECQEGMMGHESVFEFERRALDRGVKVRDILARTEKKYEIPESFVVLTERRPMFQVKYCQFPPPAILLIKDHREVLISTNSTVNMLSQPYLWSNNPILVRLIQQWYDTMWEKCED